MERNFGGIKNSMTVAKSWVLSFCIEILHSFFHGNDNFAFLHYNWSMVTSHPPLLLCRTHVALPSPENDSQQKGVKLTQGSWVGNGGRNLHPALLPWMAKPSTIIRAHLYYGAPSFLCTPLLLWLAYVIQFQTNLILIRRNIFNNLMMKLSLTPRMPEAFKTT